MSRPKCDTPGCGRVIPKGGEGHPEICPVCLACLRLHAFSAPNAPKPPIPMILLCPACGERHVDAGDFATRPHHTHACQACGFVWRPSIVATVGVQFLPGFKVGAT